MEIGLKSRLTNLSGHCGVKSRNEPGAGGYSKTTRSVADGIPTREGAFADDKGWRR